MNKKKIVLFCALIIIFIVVFIIKTKSNIYKYYDNRGIEKMDIKNIIDETMGLGTLSIKLTELLEKYDIEDEYSLVEKIVMDKFANKSVEVEMDIKPKDMPSMYGVIFEENYVVDLIKRHSGNKTSKEDYKFNLEYLKDNYEELLKFENIKDRNHIKNNYIDEYIEIYSHYE